MTNDTQTAPPAPGVARNPANYATLIAYLAVTGLGALRLAIGPEDALTLPALLQVVVAIAGAVAVYRPASRTAKLIGAAVAAAVQLLIPLVASWADLATITLYDWLGVVFAGLAAAGVLVPNFPKAAERTADGAYVVTSLPQRQAELDRVPGPDHRAD